MYSFKYNEADNSLDVINNLTGMVYEHFCVNPKTLNRWSGEEDAVEYAAYRISQLIASSPAGSVVTFDVKLLDDEMNPVSIVLKNCAYKLKLAAISNAVLVDFDHSGILLECKTPAGNRMYNIKFVDGIGLLDLTFDTSGIYHFELDSLRDAASMKLISELYPDIQKNEDLIIAVIDN